MVSSGMPVDLHSSSASRIALRALDRTFTDQLLRCLSKRCRTGPKRGRPRFGPVRQRFEHHLRSWSVKVLSAALQTILEAELQCKSTGLPDEVIARRLCQRLAQAGPAARKRR